MRQLQEQAFGKPPARRGASGSVRRSNPEIIAQAYGLPVDEVKRRLAAGEKFSI